jgi:hypothetical protein
MIILNKRQQEDLLEYLQKHKDDKGGQAIEITVNGSILVDRINYQDKAGLMQNYFKYKHINKNEQLNLH